MGRPERERGDGGAADRLARCAPPLLLPTIIFFDASSVERLKVGFFPLCEILIAF